MSHGSFNGSLSPYTKDWQLEEFYRKQDEERRLTELSERAARWLAGRLAGQSYDTLDALQRAAVALVEDWQQGALDDEMATTVRRAVVLLFAGRIDRDQMYRKCVILLDDGSVRFGTV